ncbi:MAG: ABC transporter ATP-binding protein [Gemmobacter sp.]|nr:ABC transporter ATP-binding protein [Gemmobacter sp.]
MSDDHLIITGVCAGYGDVAVLHDISFAVPRGKIVAVVGVNGAGKTTLLSAVAGLITPTRGSVVLDGADITRMPAHRRTALGLAMVPEGGRLFPFMSVRENLELGAYSSASQSTLGARMAEVMDMFPILRDREDQLAGRLSGGERQMCAVARALMSRPRILLLDEPSVGLSPLMTEKVLDTVADLAAREGLSVIIVEQRVTEVLAMADLGHILDHGRIARSGLASDLRSDRKVQETYMGL